MEIWKDIKGYEGLYQVSNLGEVRDKNNILKKYQIYDNSGQKIRRNASKIIRQKITSFPFFQYNMNMEKSGCYFDKNFFNFLRIL